MSASTEPVKDAEGTARFFHETYERLAPAFGYETREASAVPWEQVPESNRDLMCAVAVALFTSPASPVRDAVRQVESERDRLRDLLALRQVVAAPREQEGCPCGHSCEHGPHETELDHPAEPLAKLALIRIEELYRGAWLPCRNLVPLRKLIKGSSAYQEFRPCGECPPCRAASLIGEPY